MKKTSASNPILLEKILIAGVLLIFIIFGAEFVFVNNYLKNQASQVSSLQTKFEKSDSDIGSTKMTADWLKNNKIIVERTNKIVADSIMYQYQNQIITDLNRYSDQASVSVNGYTFSAPTTTSNGKPVVAQKGAAASTTTPTAGAGQGAGATVKPPAGVTSVEVTYDFGGDKINFLQFLNLLRRLESNTTRMQIASLNLDPEPTDESGNTIGRTDLTLIVYKK